MKRYIKEFATDRIKHFTELKKRYPENASIIDRYINGINRYLNAREQGLITDLEAMQVIATITERV